MKLSCNEALSQGLSGGRERCFTHNVMRFFLRFEFMLKKYDCMFLFYSLFLSMHRPAVWRLNDPLRRVGPRQQRERKLWEWTEKRRWEEERWRFPCLSTSLPPHREVSINTMLLLWKNKEENWSSYHHSPLCNRSLGPWILSTVTFTQRKMHRSYRGSAITEYVIWYNNLVCI